MRTLAWEKWISPLEKNIEKIDPDLAEQIKHRLKERDSGDPDNQFYGDLRLRDEWDDDGDDDDDDEIDEISTSLKKKNYRLLVNPFGIFVASEQVLPNASFNFWVGHTNFSITDKLAQTLEKTDGVESIDFYSRYRFRIGIGKQFKASEVHNLIETNLGANGRSNTPKPNIDDIYICEDKFAELKTVYEQVSKYPYWAVYVFPNEKIVSIQTVDLQEFQSELELYRAAQTAVGGQVVSA